MKKGMGQTMKYVQNSTKNHLQYFKDDGGKKLTA